jgi:hypothetical protein
VNASGESTTVRLCQDRSVDVVALVLGLAVLAATVVVFAMRRNTRLACAGGLLVGVGLIADGLTSALWATGVTRVGLVPLSIEMVRDLTTGHGSRRVP